MKFSILNKPKRVRPTDRGLQNKRIFESTCDPSCDGCENARGPIPYVDTLFIIGRAHFLIEIVFFFEKMHTKSGKKTTFFLPDFACICTSRKISPRLWGYITYSHKRVRCAFFAIALVSLISLCISWTKKWDFHLTFFLEFYRVRVFIRFILHPPGWFFYIWKLSTFRLSFRWDDPRLYCHNR